MLADVQVGKQGVGCSAADVKSERGLGVTCMAGEQGARCAAALVLGSPKGKELDSAHLMVP